MRRSTDKYRREIRALFDLQAPTYDGETEWRLCERLLDAIASEIERGEGLVADVGCGTGIVGELATSRGWKVIGIDTSYSMMRAAAQRVTYRIVADAHAIPLADSSCDGATIRQLLHYTKDSEVLEEARRIVEDGGWLVIAHIVTKSNDDAKWWQAVKEIVQPLRLRVYTSESHISLIERCGLIINDVKELEIARYDPWEVFMKRAKSNSCSNTKLMALLEEKIGADNEAGLVVSDQGIKYSQTWQIVHATNA